ncbi:DUF5993 family protein [Puniceicoccus vermicola]|uniref:Uncharacterized protein n=1 Tax=Puniceicoccus vermicola TaxID=388746 RepID=A0A7X1AWE4_9BACT|nr:DUF5993 family protein [Puniceicoccus vermicola]MBC2601139.1 hypothetical protein [Puniceicoccus vermicola]
MAALIFLFLLATLFAATRSPKGLVDVLFIVTFILMVILFLHHSTDTLQINL